VHHSLAELCHEGLQGTLQGRDVPGLTVARFSRQKEPVAPLGDGDRLGLGRMLEVVVDRIRGGCSPLVELGAEVRGSPLVRLNPSFSFGVSFCSRFEKKAHLLPPVHGWGYVESPAIGWNSRIVDDAAGSVNFLGAADEVVHCVLDPPKMDTFWTVLHPPLWLKKQKALVTRWSRGP